MSYDQTWMDQSQDMVEVGDYSQPAFAHVRTYDSAEPEEP